MLRMALMIAIVMISKPAFSMPFGPWTEEQQDAIRRAAVVLATASACAEIRGYTDTSARLAPVLDEMTKFGLPADEFIQIISAKMKMPDPIQPNAAGIICRAILGPPS